MQQTWAKLSDISPARLTPMLRQYLQAKAEVPDSLLFFRMGDFYELFFEDALEAAELLGLTLTSRDGVDKDQRVPMAGVPVRSVDPYIARAIKSGRTVTLCDQVEDPKDAKGIVKREVIRTITPGTVTEAELLDETANSYLGALFVRNEDAGLAFVDVTTGEFLVARIEGDVERTLFDELTRMAPKEILVSSEQEGGLVDALRARFQNIAFTKRNYDEFDPSGAREILLDLFELQTLKGIGLENEPAAAGCAGAVLSYVRQTQKAAVPHLQLPRRYSPAGYVVLDANTQRNLELVESLAEKTKRGTLLGVLDKTLTSMGSRRLRHWLLHPLLSVENINARLLAIEELFENNELRIDLRETLKGMQDLERLLSRITARAGNARDLRGLGASLLRVPELRRLMTNVDGSLLRDSLNMLDPLEDVAGAIDAALNENPPLALNEGDLIRDGYNPQLDELRTLVRGGRDWIATLQREQRERTGIQTLKVGYNKVFGYFIEVSKGAASKVPEDYIRKQTLVNAERYVTPQLKEREEAIVTAQERMQTLEYELFTVLRERVAAEARRIQQTADAIATLDVLLTLAEIAVNKNYCKPTINDSNEIHIRDGRHPVVEDLMSSNDFVPNDTRLTERARLQIVTGPNMAGKSTYLRQVALIALMAQVGSFVPAAEASIGVVDRIFTRVGASDNLVRGESTFMVEMIETANILNTATPKSLLVLDEIGRGTSTFDGISIAWSVAEHIHDRIQAKTLFATHYHELTDLGEKLEHAKNVTVAVREWGDKVIFLYRIIDGGADHSYGIQVAKLAGLPPQVIARARVILEGLESGNTAAVGLPQQMYLFGTTHEAQPSEVDKQLAATNPDDLTPKQAHEFLYHLKHLSSQPRKK